MTVFNFEDYKHYFQSLVRSKGPEGRGEYRKLAEFMNVHPTFVSQVLSGQKDFSAAQVIEVAKYFGLGKLETRYLVILVEIERAASKELRSHFVEMKQDLQRESLNLAKRIQKHKVLSDVEKSIFYSSWLYSAIHLFTTLERDVNFEHISKRFNIGPERSREILEFLKNHGLVKEVNGVLKAGITTTHLESTSPFLMKHHANWRIKALEKSESLSHEELMYSVNVSLSKKDFQKLREELVLYIQQFLKTIKDSPAEDLAQLNIDFFWI